MKEVRPADVYVIDTSALVADPSVLDAYPQANIVLPLTVIEELDRVKTRSDAAGANAREVVRTLEAIRLTAGGSLQTSVALPSGGTLRVEPNGLRLAELEQFHLAADVPDHRILASALGLAADGNKVTVVSCDGAMRLKADAVGLTAVDHVVTHEVFNPKEFPGWYTRQVDAAFVEAVYANPFVAADQIPAELADVATNEFLVAKAGTSSALVRRTADGFERLTSERRTGPVWGIKPRNKEQKFALELLTDPAIEVLAMSGKAGTGKTILALAAALEQTMESGARYDRITILRPMFSIGGQDIGFLPGDVGEKVAPWFDAVVDTMVALSETDMDHKRAKDMLTMWVETGKLTMEPVTFLRGRSLQQTFLIIDEVQNMERAAVKTILTRLGEGSKLIACGDPDQCDNPFTSTASNGLTALVDAFRGQDLFGHIALTECERSRVADLAADLL